jgi:hypothetical protein
VTVGVVWRWRKVLGVTNTNNESSRRLRQAVAEAGAAGMRARGLTDEERAERSRRATAKKLIRFARAGYRTRMWTRAQLRLLGKEPDDVVAAKVGKSVGAVRSKRTKLGIPTALDQRTRAATGNYAACRFWPFYVFFGSLDRALLPLLPAWTSALARNLLTLMLFSVNRNSMRLFSGQSLICCSE